MFQSICTQEASVEGTGTAVAHVTPIYTRAAKAYVIRSICSYRYIYIYMYAYPIYICTSKTVCWHTGLHEWFCNTLVNVRPAGMYYKESAMQ
jgi:hypothetical protein